MLRNSKIFKRKKVFFLGNILDNCPLLVPCISTKINVQKHHIYVFFQKKTKKIHVYNKLLVSKEMLKDCNTIIYFWPKNKHEARFQLMNLISCVKINTSIFIVGENSSGIKGAPLILKEWLKLEKIDSAKHCILMSGFIQKQNSFLLEDFIKTHTWKNIFIKALPGVFGYKKIDAGSILLASTFSNKIKGRVLDIGCGTGFLSASLLRKSPDVLITLIDNDVHALKSSYLTLKFNKISGEIISSDLYSSVFKKFNLIISNPPFHNDLEVNFNIIKTIISDSKNFLFPRGELRFVTNSCFHYNNLLKKIFKGYSILKKTNKYHVYQAFLL